MEIVVTDPLSSVTTADQASASLDTCDDGPSLSASDQSTLAVSELSATWVGSVSMVATGQATLSVATGRAVSVSATAQNQATLRLGTVATKSAELVASNQATITGVVAESLTIEASDESTVTTTASETAGAQCSQQATISISGSAVVTKTEHDQCSIRSASAGLRR